MKTIVPLLLATLLASPAFAKGQLPGAELLNQAVTAEDDKQLIQALRENTQLGTVISFEGVRYTEAGSREAGGPRGLAALLGLPRLPLKRDEVPDTKHQRYYKLHDNEGMVIRSAQGVEIVLDFRGEARVLQRLKVRATDVLAGVNTEETPVGVLDFVFNELVLPQDKDFAVCARGDQVAVYYTDAPRGLDPSSALNTAKQVFDRLLSDVPGAESLFVLVAGNTTIVRQRGSFDAKRSALEHQVSALSESLRGSDSSTAGGNLTVKWRGEGSFQARLDLGGKAKLLDVERRPNALYYAAYDGPAVEPAQVFREMRVKALKASPTTSGNLTQSLGALGK